MKQDNIAMLQDTLKILEQGCYVKNGQKVDLKLTREQMEEARVFLPKDVKKAGKYKDFQHVHVMGRCGYACENTDSFSLARKRFSLLPEQDRKKSKPILVLNLANPVNPGGGVRKGAKAQEEDLCRKSSLLISLESRNALPYYEYNRSLNTYLGSDAVMIQPQVEIIKDENGNLLEDSVIVAVMTCAAPMLKYGMEGLSQKQYEDMMLGRITGMLKVAAYMGYERLVLGAFGCGAFRNDARMVSDLFYKALKEYNLNITVYDPWANPAIVEHEYGIKVVNELPTEKFDAAIAAVAHKMFDGLDVPALLKEKHVIFDVKCTLERNLVDGRL